MTRYPRKTAWRRLCACLAVLLIVPMLSGCLFTEQNYENALESWEDNAIAAAMYYFTRIPDHKDSAEYIQKFETDVTASLLQTPWASQMTRGEYRWVYDFRQDGSVLFRIQEWDRGLKDFDDYLSKWEFEYGIDKETGFYEAYIKIGDERKYKIHLGVAEDGTIVVNGLQGFVSDFLGEYDLLYARDSALDPPATK